MKRVVNIVGLIPCAGIASRIAPLPCSKEIFPIGFGRTGDKIQHRPKVVSHYLLEKMRLAGAKKAFIIIRNGKWDIPEYFGDGQMFGIHLSYLMMGLPFGVPFTINQAYPFVCDSNIFFGFPDIFFKPDDTFAHLLNRQNETKADIVLGLFSVNNPQEWDTAEADESGMIRKIITKSYPTHLRYAWIVAMWTPTFTSYINEYLESLKMEKQKNNSLLVEQELTMGDIIQASIENGIKINSVCFPGHLCLDVGTPNNLLKAIKENTFFP